MSAEKCGAQISARTCAQVKLIVNELEKTTKIACMKLDTHDVKMSIRSVRRVVRMLPKKKRGWTVDGQKPSQEKCDERKFFCNPWLRRHDRADLDNAKMPLQTKSCPEPAKTRAAAD